MGMKTFPLPDPGEGLTEATIVSWKVAPGDVVRVNDVVVEIETAKSLVELPIPWAGTVAEVLVAEGEEVPVGTPIIRVDVVGEPDDPAPAAAPAAGAPPAGGGAAPRAFPLPDPGEGLTEATIVSWKVAPGDVVRVNDVVVEIETAKSLVELPIPWAGTVAEVLVAEGEEVPVGTPIITIAVAGDAPVAAPAEPEAKREPNLVGYGAIVGSTTRRARRAPAGGAAAAPPPPPPPPAPPVAAPTPTPAPAPPAPPPAHEVRAGVPVARDGRPLAKPPVRTYAKDRGVDLAFVAGSGPDGVITRGDIDAYLAAAAAPPAAAAPAVPARAEREIRVPVKGVRKMTAAAMSASAFTAPHVTEFVTLDCTPTMELVERLRGDREFRDVKVTPLLVVAKALLLACRRNPGVNASWEAGADGEVIVQKAYVNLGIAAATPRGLVVPNIKDADGMTMRELAGALTELVDTARAGRTQPADMAGGTITITNVGVFGVDTGTPIINPGESAILAVGAIRRTPWVVERDGVEVLEPRWVTQLALSFDHRLIDGDLGSRFLADVAAVLADPAKGLVWG